MASTLSSVSHISNHSGPTLIKSGKTYNLYEKIRRNTKSRRSWNNERNNITRDISSCTNADGRIMELLTNGYQNHTFGMLRRFSTHGNSRGRNQEHGNNATHFSIKIAEKLWNDKSSNILTKFMKIYTAPFTLSNPSGNTHPPSHVVLTNTTISS